MENAHSTPPFLADCSLAFLFSLLQSLVLGDNCPEAPSWGLSSAPPPGVADLEPVSSLGTHSCLCFLQGRDPGRTWPWRSSGITHGGAAGTWVWERVWGVWGFGWERVLMEVSLGDVCGGGGRVSVEGVSGCVRS